ncbi:hypothetical protein GCM10027030_32880 [Luteococcus sediminum]
MKPARQPLDRRQLLLLAADPLFDLQNHGTKHLPLSVSGRKGYAEQGTHNAGEVYDEVAGTIATLTKLTGRASRFFRSGTAHMDEVAARIVRTRPAADELLDQW